MEDEIKKHAEVRKRSENIFRKIDRTAEHSIEAAKKVTEAEKHLENTEKEQAQVDRSIRETDVSMKNTQEAIARTHEDIAASKPSKPGKAVEPSSKSPPAKRRS